MARPLRLEFAGALYHVTARGDGREDIYLSDGDRQLFLAILGAVWERSNWQIHAYCLMTNHYHLLIETPDANLAKGMRQLNGVYTQRFNRMHGRVGHVFQGRYKAILVQKESYFLELTRYVVLNPVRAGIVPAPGQWPWSSYRATIGAAPSPEWLNTRDILAAYGATAEEAGRRYMCFVADGIGQPSPWDQMKQQVFLGSDAFVEAMQQKVPGGRDLREVPQAKAPRIVKPLAYYARKHVDRDGAIVAAYASGGHTMQVIADYFGLHYSRVSKIVYAASQTRRKGTEGT